MTNGRNYGVMMAEADDLERCAKFVATEAAALVAAGDETRTDAVKLAANYLARSRMADGDPTGTLEVENTLRKPSKKMPDAQVKKIAGELMDAARKAVEDI